MASTKSVCWAFLAFLLWGAISSGGTNSDLDLNNKAKELEAALAGLNPVASLVSMADIPEDDTPKGPEDEDDASGEEKKPETAEKDSCGNDIKPQNKSAGDNTPSLVHMTFDHMCEEAEQKKIKILPVYVVGWELKHCSDINTIPYERFEMAKYQSKKPRFDIPGMCIPLKGKEMTLLMIDPDAPSRKNPKCRSWVHWVVINIAKGDVRNGKELVTYNRPTPPLGSGPHRYFFILYEQDHHINHVDDSENNFNLRCGFSVRNFAEDNSLTGPIAINMFKTNNKRKS